MPRPFVIATIATAGVLAGASADGASSSAASGADPASVTMVELPSSDHRVLSASGGDRRFTLVGLHWRGPGRVVFRTRSLEGRWGSWRPAAPESEDAPDVDSAEVRPRVGWRIGNPWWVGPSDRVEVRKIGRVTRVRAYLVWSPPISVPHRFPAAATMPSIVARASWRASESIRRGPPSYARGLRFAVVHHTAGRNSYSRAEAPAIVKAIQLYHVQGNGWNDIGYNFLVDRFGTVYEGRYGGIDRNVIGAHAQGFNTGSTGVAVLGTYGDAAPSEAAVDALTKLLAWRLELAYVDPRAKLTVLSSGNPRFAPSAPVLLRAVSGHRDTGPTECPGDTLAARLDAISAAVAKTGGPKIFEPRVDASLEGLVRFRARLSAAVPWAVVVKVGSREVARGVGTGKSVDWTWDSSAAAPATYTWSITASSARPATGSLRAGTATTELAIQEASAAPEGITPNGDGQGDAAAVAFSLTTAANVSVEVRDLADTLLVTLVDRVWKRAGKHTVTVDGANLPDGLYSIVVRARTATGAEAVEIVTLTVSRALGLVSAKPEAFSPNADGRRDRLEIGFVLAAPATAAVRIVREGRWVATPLLPAALPTGSQRVVWDGARSAGRLRDGAYTAVVDVTDEAGISVSFGVPFVVDTVAPRVSILPIRPLRVRVSEPARLNLWINGEPLSRDVARSGTVRIAWREPVRTARVVAWDAAGNASPAAIRAFGPERRGQ